MHLDHLSCSSSMLDHCKKIVQAENLSHLWIFSSPILSESTEIARAFLLDWLQVPWPQNKAPDLLSLKSSGKVALHTIASIRNLLEQLSLTPFAGKGRAVLIEAGDRMLSSSANALLKVLEEPPPNTLIALTTTVPHRILPTILSRAKLFRFPVQKEKCSPYVDRISSFFIKGASYTQLSHLVDTLLEEIEKDREEMLTATTEIPEDLSSQAKAEYQQEIEGERVLWMQQQIQALIEDLYLFSRRLSLYRDESQPLQTLLQSLDALSQGADLRHTLLRFLSTFVCA